MSADDPIILAGEGIVVNESQETLYLGNDSWKVRARRVNLDQVWLKKFVSVLLESSETNMRVAYKADIERAVREERERLLEEVRKLSPANAEAVTTVLAAEDAVVRLKGTPTLECTREHCGIAGAHLLADHVATS